jgi:hypothetical protein
MLQFLSVLDPFVWAAFAARGVLITIGIYVVRRHVETVPWRVAALALLGAFGFRLVLFGTPLTWGLFVFLLNGHIDWRQADVMVAEAKASMNTPRPLPLLAVGSSQTGAIYHSLSHGDQRLQLYSLAGMSPVDMILYQDRIVALRACTVLLYVSDFDLATPPRPEVVRYAPVPPWRIGYVAAVLESALPRDATATVRRDLWVGWLFPEFRYRFVFRALLRRVGAVVHIPGLNFEPPGGDVAASKFFHETVSVPMGPMELLLRDFVALLGEHGSRVLIVEGEYNPKFDDPILLPKRIRAFAFLSELERDFPFVRILRRDKLPTLTDKDYQDAYHVTPEAGLRIAQAVLRFVGGYNCNRIWKLE